jgi:hypothetical protein
MIFTIVLGIVIGLSFIFFVLSLIAMWIQEIIATMLKWRSKHLAKAIKHLIDPSDDEPKALTELKKVLESGVPINPSFLDKPLAAFYDHPIIRGMRKRGKLPSYIPSKEFALVLLDMLSTAGLEDSGVSRGIGSVKAGIGKLKNETTKKALMTIVDAVEDQTTRVDKRLGEARKQIEVWFDSSMERISGWYKRKTQIVAIFVSLFLAVALNVDTIRITSSLWSDALLRLTVQEAAAALAEGEDDVGLKEAYKRLDEVGFPIGWTPEHIPTTDAFNGISKSKIINVLVWLAGLLLTGFAVSQGSPFWFDILRRFTKLRGAGKKPEEEESEAA